MAAGGDVLDLDVEAVLARTGVPGCSVAVLEDGEVVLERGFGTSRVGSAAPVTVTTRMPACSMSKPVSVVAALRLVERGLLDLDADVSDRLTRWKVPANGDWRPRITLRQLASHTAGLTAHSGFPGYRRGTSVPSLVDVLSGADPANAPGARVDMVPGVQFRYSGVGTTVIQLLMEEVTGMSAADLLAQLVLEPLGMQASTFVQELDDDERAHGHLPGGRPVPGGWRVQPEQCAAGLWTTAGDYVRFLDAIQRACAGDLDAFLTSGTARELLRPLAALPSGREMTGMSHIGLGFFLAVPDGAPTWFGHTGSNTGFVCASLASVSGQRGAVVMLNSDNGSPALKLLLQSIARTRQWHDCELDDQPPRDRPRGIGARAGSFISDDGLVVGLADRDGEVELTVPGQPPIRLRFDDATTLSTEALDLRVRLDADGSIALEQGGHVLRAVHKPSDPSRGEAAV
ncbi:MAG TPA: serine hydrolase domain-containing protein [Nocardioides sp.]|uniref:serine hydrolase domain-containing protein n=1 Tax=Nocardioides sp. TaxID=35761 RepID=UPI002E37822C|nr:serine hydrolase domain-containing protein [Nocardioides sp.]HEX5087388.1 serine hydrolase domain-containing protein [Nocardioides sp.]